MNPIIIALVSAAKFVGRSLALPFVQTSAPNWLHFCARWGLHLVCMLGVIVGLGYLNHVLHLDRLLLTPFPALRNWWLPIVFVQCYGISWLAWWLVQVLTKTKQVTEYADLQRAWQRVESGLVSAGIDPRHKPLYLLLGKPAAGAATFLKAGQIDPLQIGASSSETQPFQLFATEEALFLSCDDNSLLGLQSEMLQQAERLAAERPTHPQRQRRVPGIETLAAIDFAGDGFSPTSDQQATGNAGSDDSMSWGNSAGGGAVATATLAPPVRAVAKESLQMVESNIALLVNEAVGYNQAAILAQSGVTYQPTAQYSMPILQDALLIEQTSARLAALCQLLATLRSPFCPLNGIVVLVPFSCTQDAALANHTGMLIDADLQTIADATLIDAPRIAVFCDLQATAGCTEMLARFPEQQRHRRLGVKFPRMAACDRSDMDSMIRSGTRWLCEQLIPPIINRLFVVEQPASGGGRDSNVGNERLFDLMETVRQRKEQVERVLRRGFQGEAQPSELLRGCYFAATGRQAATEQGFVAGILSQVVEMQDEVKWTQAAKLEDAECRWWTVMGYAGLAVATCVTALLCLL